MHSEHAASKRLRAQVLPYRRGPCLFQLLCMRSKCACASVCERVRHAQVFLSVPCVQTGTPAPFCFVNCVSAGSAPLQSWYLYTDNTNSMTSDVCLPSHFSPVKSHDLIQQISSNRVVGVRRHGPHARSSVACSGGAQKVRRDRVCAIPVNGALLSENYLIVNSKQQHSTAQGAFLIVVGQHCLCAI